MPKNSSAEPKRNVFATLIGILGMSGIAGVLVAALMTPLVAVAGVAANSSVSLFESLPDYLEIQPLQQRTELYGDLNGQRTKFATFYAQNRIEVSLSDVSHYVIDAAVSTEDPRFYEHGGVDVISAARALLVSVIGDDGGGASTITMQYVRNQRVQAAEAILAVDEKAGEKAYQDATEETLGRKLQEMRLAIGVEKQFSKDQILQGYLNIALFGGQIYGIESAAQYYFGKAAKDLTLSEAATLVATVQNPNSYAIDKPENIPGATARRNYVLNRMYEEGKISQQDRDAAQAEPITPKITPSTQGCSNAEYNTQYFCAYMIQVIRQDPIFGATPQERLFNFQTKGYQIDTTIDLDLQQKVTDTIHELLPKSMDDVNFGGAAVAIDPKTGGILAMQQNTDYAETDDEAKEPGATAINFNVDEKYGGSIGFQPGSTYKVFTLANWLQSGHSLYESFNASTRTYDNFPIECTDRVGSSAPYNPGNDEGLRVGSINAMRATQDSINTGFLAMAQQLDQCTTADIAESLGAHNADGKPLEVNPSDIIGSGNNKIAPLSLATAFGAIANNGVTCEATPIKKLALLDGTEIQLPDDTCKKAIDPNVAHATAAAMKTVMSAGSGTASNPGLTSQIIGKTGTTGGESGAEQTWMVAATTNFSLAVWVGNYEQYCVADDSVDGGYNCWGTSMRDIGYGWTRHEVARPILAAGITEYGADVIPDPTGELTTVPNVTVPDVTGLSVDAATAALESAGFTVSVGDAVPSTEAAGTVARQNPSGNTRSPSGGTVTIYPSSGDSASSSGVAMPNLIGMTRDQAEQALSQASMGSDGNKNTYVWNGPADGKVTATSPNAGETVPPGASVTITAQ